jgi:hypothetical protein
LAQPYNSTQTVTTSFITPLNQTGEIEVRHTTNQVHVLIDVPHYSGPADPAGLYFYALPRPIRINDTTGTRAARARRYANPIRTGSTHVEKATITCQGVTVPASARVIVGNATMSETSPTTTNTSISNGFVTFYPTRIQRPGTVNLQLPLSATVGNQVIRQSWQ